MCYLHHVLLLREVAVELEVLFRWGLLCPQTEHGLLPELLLVWRQVRVQVVEKLPGSWKRGRENIQPVFAFRNKKVKGQAWICCQKRLWNGRPRPKPLVLQQPIGLDLLPETFMKWKAQTKTTSSSTTHTGWMEGESIYIELFRCWSWWLEIYTRTYQILSLPSTAYLWSCQVFNLLACYTCCPSLWRLEISRN